MDHNNPPQTHARFGHPITGGTPRAEASDVLARFARGAVLKEHFAGRPGVLESKALTKLAAIQEKESAQNRLRRTRLLDRMSLRTEPLCVICAPTGFGKTELCLQYRSSAPSAKRSPWVVASKPAFVTWLNNGDLCAFARKLDQNSIVFFEDVPELDESLSSLFHLAVKACCDQGAEVVVTTRHPSVASRFDGRCLKLTAQDLLLDPEELRASHVVCGEEGSELHSKAALAGARLGGARARNDVLAGLLRHPCVNAVEAMACLLLVVQPRSSQALDELVSILEEAEVAQLWAHLPYVLPASGAEAEAAPALSLPLDDGERVALWKSKVAAFDRLLADRFPGTGFSGMVACLVEVLAKQDDLAVAAELLLDCAPVEARIDFAKKHGWALLDRGRPRLALALWARFGWFDLGVPDVLLMACSYLVTRQPDKARFLFAEAWERALGTPWQVVVGLVRLCLVSESVVRACDASSGSKTDRIAPALPLAEDGGSAHSVGFDVESDAWVLPDGVDSFLDALLEGLDGVDPTDSLSSAPSLGQAAAVLAAAFRDDPSAAFMKLERFAFTSGDRERAMFLFFELAALMRLDMGGRSALRRFIPLPALEGLASVCLQRTRDEGKGSLLEVMACKELQALVGSSSAFGAYESAVRRDAFLRTLESEGVEVEGASAKAGKRRRPDEVPLDLLVVRLFGGFSCSVFFNEGAVDVKLRDKAALFLSLLAIKHGRDVSREWLSQLMWPDESCNGPKQVSLNSMWSTLTRAVGGSQGKVPFMIKTKTAIKMLDEWVVSDLAELESLCETVEEGRRFDKVQLLRAVKDLYLGELLPGVDNEEVAACRKAWKRRMCDVLSSVAEDLMQEREFDLALSYLDFAQQVDPLSEKVCWLQSRSLCEVKQYFAAMDAIIAYRKQSREVYATDGSARLNELYNKLLAESEWHDALLDEAEAQEDEPIEG